MPNICDRCMSKATPEGVECPDCGCTWQSYDLGYAILEDGDILTSDGKPRMVDELQLKMVAEKAAAEGREIEFRFRAPTTQERDSYGKAGIL